MLSLPGETLLLQREFDELLASVQLRVGWDFARMSTLRAPVPWEHAEVVERYLQPSEEVLDIGTGGGKRFAAMAGRADATALNAILRGNVDGRGFVTNEHRYLAMAQAAG